MWSPRLPRLLFRTLLGRRLPTTVGMLHVPGLRGDVTVRRDRWGVPYIKATCATDGWFGLGFCQGQDRAFQIEMLARTVRGRLSELIGPKALPVDRLSRRIGFRRAAAEQIKSVDAGVRDELSAFASGVVAGVHRGQKRRAHEFAILGREPLSFDSLDALGVLGLLSFGLASNWDAELMRLAVLSHDGAESLRAIDPVYRDWFPVSAPTDCGPTQVVDHLARDLALFSETIDKSGCSNNWVVAGERTATGRPILANDPHLVPVLPPHWYLAHVTTPQWSVAGAAFVGTPGIAVGHNGVSAWGVTAGFVDSTDLFLERLGDDGESVLVDGRYVPCQTIRETIEVRGGATHVEDVIVTSRGPILSHVLEGFDQALSLRAVWLDDLPVRGLLRLPTARSFEAFRAELAEWPFASLNVVYADTGGTIGWQLAGQAPQRNRGAGTLPLPGWISENHWSGELVDFEKMPFLRDPEERFIATANNKPQADGVGPYLGADWLDGYRVARLRATLAERDDWSVESTLRLQLDTKSLVWEEIRDTILSVSATDTDVAMGLQLLREWDGDLDAGSSAASVFQFLLAGLYELVTSELSPESARIVLGAGCTRLLPHSTMGVRRAGHLSWLLRSNPPADDILAGVVGNAVRALRGRFGIKMTDWAWGKIRPLVLRHPLGVQPYLRPIFNRGPFPLGGDANTVAQAATDLLDPSGDVLLAPSLRVAIDVGNWDSCLFALPGGQSGNPLSPHYDDQLELWRAGDGIRIAWSEEAQAREVVSTLKLAADGEAN